MLTKTVASMAWHTAHEPYCGTSTKPISNQYHFATLNVKRHMANYIPIQIQRGSVRAKAVNAKSRQWFVYVVFADLIGDLPLNVTHTNTVCLCHCVKRYVRISMTIWISLQNNVPKCHNTARMVRVMHIYICVMISLNNLFECYWLVLPSHIINSCFCQ